MNMLLLFLLMLINTGISIWNAYACGAYLTESRIIGGWSRVLVWCGLIMSACGFTWVYLTIITLVTVSLGYLTQQQGMIMFKLGYLTIIIPILSAGTVIWVKSLIQAYRTKSFSDVAVAGWNTFAHVHNAWSAASQAPSALKEVMKFFTSDSGDSDSDSGKGLALIILLVVLALVGGVMTTASIARWADRRVAINVVAQ